MSHRLLLLLASCLLAIAPAGGCCCLPRERVYYPDDCGEGCGAGCGECQLNGACGHGSGCRHPLWQHLRQALACGGGCGDIYWGEWISDPPDPCDPCDDCGQWTGPQCCVSRWEKFKAGLRGERWQHCGCGTHCCDTHGGCGLDSCGCGDPGCGGGCGSDFLADSEIALPDELPVESWEVPDSEVQAEPPMTPTPAKQAMRHGPRRHVHYSRPTVMR